MTFLSFESGEGDAGPKGNEDVVWNEMGCSFEIFWAGFCDRSIESTRAWKRRNEKWKLLIMEGKYFWMDWRSCKAEDFRWIDGAIRTFKWFQLQTCTAVSYQRGNQIIFTTWAYGKGTVYPLPGESWRVWSMKERAGRNMEGNLRVTNIFGILPVWLMESWIGHGQLWLDELLKARCVSCDLLLAIGPSF